MGTGVAALAAGSFCLSSLVWVRGQQPGPPGPSSCPRMPFAGAGAGWAAMLQNPSDAWGLGVSSWPCGMQAWACVPGQTLYLALAGPSGQEQKCKDLYPSPTESQGHRIIHQHSRSVLALAWAGLLRTPVQWGPSHCRHPIVGNSGPWVVQTPWKPWGSGQRSQQLP